MQTICNIQDEKVINSNQCTKDILRGGSHFKQTKIRKCKIVKKILFVDRKTESAVTQAGEELSHAVHPQVGEALSHDVHPLPKPPVILGKKTLQNYSSKFKHTILSTPRRQGQFHEYEL